MAIYAIGDVHGQYDLLCRLLETCGFSGEDRVWFVGDVVNRGPQSLEVCRFIRSLGDQAVMVLGNHDFYCLSVASGVYAHPRHDTLDPILEAPDREEIVDWLRYRPLIHVEDKRVLLHAGLIPQWTVDKAVSLAHEVERALRKKDYKKILKCLYGNKPNQWKDNLQGENRLRFIVNALCRLRFCTVDGVLDFKIKGKPNNPPKGYLPWYSIPNRKSSDYFLITGHWSALNLRMTKNHISIDTGSCWGGGLTAVRLDDQAVFHVL